MELITSININNDMFVEVRIDDLVENPLNTCSERGGVSLSLEHSRYSLGNEYAKNVKLDDADWRIRISAYEHGDITLSIGEIQGWDYTDVGIAYIRKKDMQALKMDNAAALKQTEQILDTYNSYLRGDAYIYTLYRSKVCGCCNHMGKEELDEVSDIGDMLTRDELYVVFQIEKKEEQEK